MISEGIVRRYQLSDFEQRIMKILSECPGAKAKEIAHKLNCEKTAVNSALYGSLKNYCYQDSLYQWYLKDQKIPKNEAEIQIEPDKMLAGVCRYYLDCLSLEESNGISAFLSSCYSLDYAELDAVSVDGTNDQVARLIQKVSAEKNLTAHVGYPVMIKRIHSTKTGKDYLKIAPVLLFPVEISGGAVEVASIPHVNMEVIKQYSNHDINSQVYDLVALEEELGFNSMDTDADLDEIVSRLQAIREWQWKGNMNPSRLDLTHPVSTIEQEGIYNKAIFIVSERSPYTIGLETELSQLAQVDEASYKETALYDWIHNTITPSVETGIKDIPLLEVLPMNLEQEQAIIHAARNKLTIVTGPPGTGKSQIVTNLLINAAWSGLNVLFTSKNNKAVDVVETRINALGRRPVMIRIGSNQSAYHLAELISSLLSNYADRFDHEEYRRYHSLYEEKMDSYRKLKTTKDEIIKLRNRVDRMERKVCDLRDEWGQWFGEITEEEVGECKHALEEYASSYERWFQSKNSFFGKALWFAIGKRKTEQVETALSHLDNWFEKYGQQQVFCDGTNLDEKKHKRIYDRSNQLVDIMQTIVAYREALEDLLNVNSCETVDRDLMNAKADLADIAAKLWNTWLITRPLDIDAACRREMNEYVTAMQLIGDVDLSEYPDIRKKFNRLQRKMTSFVPCWAVTSLSAKGRIPFEPGIFDLVVIDEASQCDIASVLPMLYRAKKAVIIGDPKQLSHISSISKKQDVALLQKHNLDMGWSYYANSLYGKASSLADASHIVQLRDHHRSFGDIIEFSNIEFYDCKLRIATNYEKLHCPPNYSAGIRWIDVVGNTIRPTSGGAYNDFEVDAILKELERLVIENEYKGTVGVVTPFRAQAERIRKCVENNVKLKRLLIHNDFLVDTVHKFQGDERDLMFFSPVISKGTSQGALGFLRNTGNLFNVAITRARAVLVVVGDANYCSKCGVTYMEHFTDYVNRVNSRHEKENTYSEDYPTEKEYPKVANPEQVSEWERVLYKALFEQGIRTIPQYPADKYKLDLAIIAGNRMLDIEVDGEMYHRDWSGELSYRDQLRNQRLFELGWDVKRFWVYQIRDDLQGCVDQIKCWCDKQ